MSDKVFIYGLEDPRVRKFFYVGSSSDPCKRFKEHLRAKCTDVTPVVKELDDQGLFPILVILEEVAPHERRRREHDWMRFYKELNHSLVNRKVPQNAVERGDRMTTMNVSLPQKLIDAISEEATRRDVTRSDYVRTLLQSVLSSS